MKNPIIIDRSILQDLLTVYIDHAQFNKYSNEVITKVNAALKLTNINPQPLTDEEVGEIEEVESSADTLVMTLPWNKVSPEGNDLLQRGWGMIQDGLKQEGIAQGE